MNIYQIVIEYFTYYLGWSKNNIVRNILYNHEWLYDRKKSILRNLKFMLYKYLDDGDIKKLELPKLPIPELKNTLELFEESIEHILDNDEMLVMEKIIEDFKKKGDIFQELLKDHSQNLEDNFNNRNWLNNWWLDYAYLSNRSSLYYTNWYGTDYIKYFGEEYSDDSKNKYTNFQIHRATLLIIGLLNLNTKINDKNLNTQKILGLIPLCMKQFDNLFATNRIPVKEKDILQKYPDSKHIIIRIGEDWFKVDLSSLELNQNRNNINYYTVYNLLNSIISEQFQEKLNTNTDTSADDTQNKVASLTSLDRDEWCNLRINLMKKNKNTIETIESSLFILHLDTLESNDMDQYCKDNFIGKGYYWMDKSFNIVVYHNGRVGVHAEHSWGDAPCLSDAFEMLMEENCNMSLCPNIDEITPLKYDKLKWNLDIEDNNNIKKALQNMEMIKNMLDIKFFKYENFGKKKLKDYKISADGFIQLAIQLAYYKINEKVVLTYESCHTRLYEGGRTETIRTVSKESSNFVKNPTKENLMKALEQHTVYTCKALDGHAIDRHLFGLYIVYQGLLKKIKDDEKKLSEKDEYLIETNIQINKEIEELDNELDKELDKEKQQQEKKQEQSSNDADSDKQKINDALISADNFFNSVGYKLKWKLSTSQVQCKYTYGGGFMPVDQDGYGISYVVKDDIFSFHISSYKISKDTDSLLFNKVLEESLDFIMGILEEKKDT